MNDENSLGITQEYNKENRNDLWDSAKGKKQYKDKVFENKKTYDDPISGKVLHKSQNAAQKKYHMKNSENETISRKWAEHSAETDHINAIKDVHNAAKHNPFLSDNDFKETVNSEKNYRILSKSQNASKGEKSDWEIIADNKNGMSANARRKMAGEKISADISLHAGFASRTAKNIGKTSVEGAKEGLSEYSVLLIADGVDHIINVVSGNEKLEDAVKDMGKETAKTAVKGAAIKNGKIIGKQIEAELSNLMHVQLGEFPFIKTITDNNVIPQLIQVATLVAKSASKFIDGEINAGEFMMEIGDKGVTMVTGMIGGEVGSLIGSIIGSAVLPVVGSAIGSVVGKLIGTMITTVACSAIIAIRKNITATLKSLNDYKIKEKEIHRLEVRAISEMKRQREKFRSIVEQEFQKWDNTIESGFNQILSSACEEEYNLQGITDGLDKILSVFGKEAAFKNIEEYKSQLNMTLELNF